jgi:hypothetical protein
MREMPTGICEAQMAVRGCAYVIREGAMPKDFEGILGAEG